MNKKISWENWNQLEKDFLKKMNAYCKNDFDEIEDEDDEYSWKDSHEEPDKLMSLASLSGSQSFQTPFGMYPIDSLMRPSDRWNCWIIHTNFNISARIYNILEKEIDGIAALIIIDRYTACIGIGKLFNETLVKEKIEERLLSLDNEDSN